MTLISLNIDSAVGLKDLYARISYWLTVAGFKVTCLWEDYPFVDSIQGDERERLLRFCKAVPFDCVAYGDGIIVVLSGFGKIMEKLVRDIEELQMEQCLPDVSTKALGARLHELVRLSDRLRANSDGSIEIALPRTELAVLTGISQWQSFWRLPGRLLLRWFILTIVEVGNQNAA